MSLNPFKASTLLAVLAFATAAKAQEAEAPAASLQAVYTADLVGVFGHDAPQSGKYLDNLDVIGDADLGRAIGWRGAKAHVYVLNNSGGAPNDVAGTLQGVDNIEVASPRLRLFELWLDQSFSSDRASFRAGLYNLNSEFYVSDAAGRLLQPAFGIGSELAATGPNGPSIFPSTALGARLNVDVTEGVYARAAVLNAHAGVLGDPKGVDFSFNDGVLEIVEIGVERGGKISLGGWRYSRRQEDIRDVDTFGAPARAIAGGAYLLAEGALVGAGDDARVKGFVRAGLSDARTTPFRGGWQAGVVVTRPIAARPDGELTIGLQQGLLSSRFRDNLRDEGTRPLAAETAVEVTYADRLSDRISVQPDLQWIRRADAPAGERNRFVAAMRVKVTMGVSR